MSTPNYYILHCFHAQYCTSHLNQNIQPQFTGHPIIRINDAKLINKRQWTANIANAYAFVKTLRSTLGLVDGSLAGTPPPIFGANIDVFQWWFRCRIILKTRWNAMFPYWRQWNAKLASKTKSPHSTAKGTVHASQIERVAPFYIRDRQPTQAFPHIVFKFAFVVFIGRSATESHIIYGRILNTII